MAELWSPGLTIAPTIAAGRNKPVGPLASDAGVNAAYQALMRAITQGDEDKGNFQRMLTTNLDRSNQERAKAQLGSRQALADRGIFSSGAGLQRQGDIDTQYDQYNTDVNDAINQQIGGIGRNITGLEDAYQNEQLFGSERYTAAQAAAADAAIKRQQEVDSNEAMMQALMGSLAQMTAPQPAPAPPTYTPPPVYHPPAPKPLVSKPGATNTAISGQTGYLLQKPKAGPQ